ncbi:hypothetical protein [Pandoraea apista]|uniref:hypothetical protein n=1 Tax=Pandoraea apista TaxID=93218 RepID=UPI00065E0627|nr:hypothetical protein [Pandoraea apista]ALS65644.1 hypothetical protein AT395_12140 [Pandoraea apista]RRW97912.1 hypothetical protein EGJ54_06910 [Pandoraea apista]RRX07103.1 hypothetical protein EGJ56_04215 [Pandoraea apista]
MQPKRYAALNARSSDQRLRTFAAEVKKLQTDGSIGIRALVDPAPNENLLSDGHDDYVVTVGCWSR